MNNKKTIYYEDELNEEFSTAKIEPRKIDENYKYIHKNVIWNACAFLLQNVLSLPIKYLYANAPNRAAKAESNPGLKTSDWRTGVRGIIQITPRARTKVVTIVLVAIEIVETISPSLLPCFTLACSRALTAQGNFKLTRLPVKKAR